jgi:hypothetical protein
MINAIHSAATAGMATSATEYALAPHIILLLVHDGTARLLDMDGRFYALTAMGATMLRETLDRGTAAAVQTIAAQYGVAAQQVHRDLETFLRALEAQRLLHRPGSHRHQRRGNTTLPFLLLTPLLHVVHSSGRALRTRVWVVLTLARLWFWLFGWARTIAAWQRYHGTTPAGTPMPEQAAFMRAVDAAIRAVAARHVFGVGCKERSVCCWSLLRAAGVPATVVLGVNLFPLASHCWCEADSRTWSDEQEQCARFTPVARYA